MSRWAEAFAALSRGSDTLDTLRHSEGATARVSQSVKSVTAAAEPPAPSAAATKATEAIKGDLTPTPEIPTPGYTPAEGQVISPSRWAQPAMAADEPSFEDPYPERRGLVERRGPMFVHFCIECGRWGAYGYGTSRTHPGRWYCRLHRPDEER
jgi:hypothetical protein